LPGPHCILGFAVIYTNFSGHFCRIFDFFARFLQLSNRHAIVCTYTIRLAPDNITVTHQPDPETLSEEYTPPYITVKYYNCMTSCHLYDRLSWHYC